MKKYSILLSLGLLTMGLSSCLKDDMIDDQKYGMINLDANKLAQLPVASKSFALLLENKTTTLDFLQVSLASSEPAAEDVTVTLSTDQTDAKIADYNTANSASVLKFPSDKYTLPGGLKVTIPKGSRSAYLKLTTNQGSLDPAHPYALAFNIVSVDKPEYVISGNYNTTLVRVSAKNPYDGVFTYTTSANTSLVPNANKTVSLVTVNASTVSLSPGLLGTYTNEVTYTVDPSTNKVTVTCPSLGVQTPQDTRSNWNPATKVMTVFWKQGNGGRTFEETFTYKGVR